ncbi:TetR/AcrR family transcriptional regulator [Rheinheimera texasensis]|jgi:TetR/AcrR family transcriptional regulator of autoinduction and epiphytic fitness|uniref:TetR/AcrR family transcriptional regulator n=1 Tax=Rheinheimera texasensis TaxID=306205 RepID=UPI0004E1C9DE|nr:TetR/AcrR family transcriptional regulator [Rheinheimera texasensis]
MMEPVGRSAQKRQAVINAALAEFKDKGFVGASMDAIAERAQVSKRTVYNHFASKELLFNEVTGSFWVQTKQAASLQFDASRPVQEQLLQIARSVWTVYQSETLIEQARIVLAELIRQPELVEQALAQVNDQECGLLPFLHQAVAAGVLQIPDIKIAETQFWGLMKSFAFWPAVFRFHDYSAQAEQVLHSNVQMFVRQYLPG